MLVIEQVVVVDLETKTQITIQISIFHFIIARSPITVQILKEIFHFISSRPFVIDNLNTCIFLEIILHFLLDPQ